MDSLSISIIAFLVVFVGYSVSAAWVNRPRNLKDGSEAAELPRGLQLVWAPANILAEAMGALNDSLMPARRAKVQNKLVVAGLHCPPNFIFGAEAAYGIGYALTLAMLGMCFTRSLGGGVAGALLGGFLGAIYPDNILTRTGEERQTAILRALPFAIDLIGSAMQAGVDFVAAVRYYVSTEKPTAPLAVEFGIVLRSMEVGKTRMDAIAEMGRRVQADAFTAFCDAVVHGMEVGASIVNTMKIQAEELRRVRFNIAERKAARAASAMIFPIAVFIMPAMFLIIGAPILIRVAASGLGSVMK
ncbi:MAG: type II secretion system F family protein [Victivallales bacterium]|nr:type II secretion system F family protein [Victivallales bacterium]